MFKNRLSPPDQYAGKLKGGFFYALSFLVPLKISHLHSSVSGKLTAYWYRGRLVVNNGSANYAFGNLHRIFQSVLKSNFEFISQSNRILILGFGAGSIYYILRNDLNFKGLITRVEIDQMMVDLFWVWNTEADPLLNLLTANAADFEDPTLYQVILIDLFIGLNHAPLLLHPSFVKKLKSFLLPGGKVLINTIFSEEALLQRSEMLALWNLHFKHCKWIPVLNSNYILECS